MSILWGVRKKRGMIASQAEVAQMSRRTEQYATGPKVFYCVGRLGMGFQSHVTHERSRLENGARGDLEGNVLTFDGRLDNYRALANELGMDSNIVSDSELVLAAFERWDDDCFARLTGDWAIALWSERRHRLYLARDHAGARTMYFTQEQKDLLWSTCLDTFVLNNADRPLSQTYAARYLSCLPIRELTPYEGIFAVPPGHYLVFAEQKMMCHRHWNAVVSKSIRYKTDVEYEEHFLALFRNAVSRRTGPGAPILAELSGGMDSTAIVCMSDRIRRSSDPYAEILDTISYFDDTETSLDEKRYFSIAEKIRGKTGTHVDVGFRHRTFRPHDASVGRYLLPGADSFSFEQDHRFGELVRKGGYRSILSGIGGDEVLGGVPNGLPELADHLMCFRFGALLQQGSLIDRSPLVSTVAETARYAFRMYCPRGFGRNEPPSWISNRLAERVKDAMPASRRRPYSHWSSPSRLDNAVGWWAVMETLPHQFPQILHRLEYRYPYLDKDLVEYLFSIPRAQILRPGRRRSLMRRALLNIVPREVLERRRKAYQLRAPLQAMRDASESLRDLMTTSLLAQYGFVTTEKLLDALSRITQGDAGQWQAVMRAIAFELWLRSSDRTFEPCAGGKPALGRTSSTAG